VSGLTRLFYNSTVSNILKKAVEVTLLSPPHQKDDSATLDATLNIHQNGVQLLACRRRHVSSAYGNLCGSNRNSCGQFCQSDCERCSELQAPSRDGREDIEDASRRLGILHELCSHIAQVLQIRERVEQVAHR